MYACSWQPAAAACAPAAADRRGPPIHVATNAFDTACRVDVQLRQLAETIGWPRWHRARTVACSSMSIIGHKPHLAGVQSMATSLVAKTARPSKSTIDSSCSIFICRHGDRYDREIGGWNGATSFWEAAAAHPAINSHDPPLSAVGHLQAQALANFFTKGIESKPPVHVTKLLVSPYIRTLQTLAPLAAASNLPLLVEDGLAEGTPDAGFCYHLATSVAACSALLSIYWSPLGRERSLSTRVFFFFFIHLYLYLYCNILGRPSVNPTFLRSTSAMSLAYQGHGAWIFHVLKHLGSYDTRPLCISSSRMYL
eukprot:SAG31_NODE_5011_length_2802_cov_6.880133_3_plen_310_part_00